MANSSGKTTGQIVSGELRKTQLKVDLESNTVQSALLSGPILVDFSHFIAKLCQARTFHKTSKSPMDAFFVLLCFSPSVFYDRSPAKYVLVCSTYVTMQKNSTFPWRALKVYAL